MVLIDHLSAVLVAKKLAWQQKRVRKSIIAAHSEVFKYANPHQVSLQYRITSDQQYHPHLIYGSLAMNGVLQILDSISTTLPDQFVDLGSGDGQALIGFAMAHEFKKLIGIELVKPLYELSLKNFGLACLQAKEYIGHDRRIQFQQGDFLNCFQVKMPCVLLFNASGYFGSCWLKVCSFLEQIPSDSIVIIISKKISMPEFAIIANIQVEVSWGWATAYIYSKEQ